VESGGEGVNERVENRKGVGELQRLGPQLAYVFSDSDVFIIFCIDFIFILGNETAQSREVGLIFL